MSLKLDQKNWGDSKKVVARQDTIIDQYRSVIGNKIPRGRQYWTMCGQCSSPSGDLQEGCELHHMLKERMLTPGQFHGAEIVQEISRANVKACPESNWYNLDIYLAMKRAKRKDNFKPSLVNLDFVSMADKSCGYFADVMNFLSSCKGKIMLVGNVMLKYQRFPSRTRDIEFVMDKLNKDSGFQSAYQKANWHFSQKYYPYEGTGKESRTTMGTLVFFKMK